MRRRTANAAPAPPASTAVDSLQRGLEALRCFQPGEDVLGVAELALRLELPRATTLRLLTTLEAHGFLRRMPGSDLFGLNVGCLFVGQAFLGSSALVRKARPALQNLANRFNLHVVLCVPAREQMLVLVHVNGKSANPLPLGAGLSLPVATTAIGCAWLWSQRPVIQGDWIAHLRDDAGAQGGPTQVAKIYQAFHDIERDGVCTSSDGWRKGVAMMASSLSLRDGSTAAVGLLRGSAEPGGALFDPECGYALREATVEIRDSAHSGRV
jgi:DNA-binding IclR family transcriptional regulator